MSTHQAPTKGGNAAFVSVADAAALLGVSPWEIERLVEQDAVRYVTLIDSRSLDQYRERHP